MTLEKVHDILSWPAFIFLSVSLITAAFKIILAGFPLLFWLLLGIYFLVMIVLIEATQIRMFLKDKTKLEVYR